MSILCLVSENECLATDLGRNRGCCNATWPEDCGNPIFASFICFSGNSRGRPILQERQFRLRHGNYGKQAKAEKWSVQEYPYSTWPNLLWQKPLHIRPQGTKPLNQTERVQEWRAYRMDWARRLSKFWYWELCCSSLSRRGALTVALHKATCISVAE